MIGEFITRDVRAPFDGAVVQNNTWWMMKDGHGVFYRSTPKSRHLYPQCNAQEAIVRMMHKKPQYEGFDVEFLEVSYLPPDHG